MIIKQSTLYLTIVVILEYLSHGTSILLFKIGRLPEPKRIRGEVFPPRREKRKTKVQTPSHKASEFKKNFPSSIAGSKKPQRL